MRFFGRYLAVLALAASPVAAGENVWSAVPFAASDNLPYQIFLSGDRQVLYSSSFTRLLRSDDGGRRWTSLAPLSGVLKAVDPRDPEVLFQDHVGILQRSRDGGKSWVWVVRDAEPIQQVLISQYFPGRVYAASRLSLWRSDDGGASFGPSLALPGNEFGNAVALAEAADGGLYHRRSNSCSRHCSRDWRIYRSADRGASWLSVRSGLENEPLIGMAIPHPSRPEAVYFLLSSNSLFANLLFSEDRGATVVDRGPLPGGGQLFTDSSSPDSLYLAGGERLWRSADRGVSWQEMAVPAVGPEGTYSLFVYGDPGRFLIYRQGFPSGPSDSASAYRSEDGGAHWTAMPPIESLFPASVSEMTLAGPSGVIYLGTNGGGIYRSVDGGASWQSFAAPQVAGWFEGDPFDGDTVYAKGYLQNESGILRSRDGGRTFSQLVECPPIHDLVAYARGGATTLVASIRDGGVARSSDGGLSWTFGPVYVDAFTRVVELEDLAVSGETVYGESFGEIFGSADGGATWSLRASGAVDMAAGGGVLAFLNGLTNQIEVSKTGGPPFTRHPLPFLAYDRGWLELEADQYGALYLIGYGVMLRSRDFGRTWQSLAQGLPDLAFDVKVLADPLDRDHVYWASDPGLYEGRFADNPPLALLNGRFEARLRWRTGASADWTAGAAASISDQSGVFHLFTPERAEVAVQMLDGRMLSGHFWVFVAAMTDVELEVEVKDRISGEKWLHHQPLGEMKSVAELAAFPREAEPSAASLPSPFGGIFEQQPVVTLDNRFEISVSWLGAGEVHVAQGRRLLGKTAAFTFFDPGAVDVLINVIDGRPLNGKFWIFGGSLTDVGFVLTVKDLVTGVVKSHHHPAGTFAGFSDTAAF